MDGATQISQPARAPPDRVSFSPAAPRCLSIRLGSTAPAARRPLAWLSLQGRLVGADEATSSAAIGGVFSREEAAAWELLGPLHRVLIVAVAAVAAGESKRARVVKQLQRSVDLRDEVLESMQQKLEDLCEQMNSAKDQPVPECKSIELCNCGRRLPDLNPETGIAPLYSNSSNKPKDANGSEYSEIFSTNQQEERRMSDLSFCSSVNSSVDIQLSSLAAEQEVYNLRKECEEKDATIKELAAVAHATRVADSKRITELEEIIRRKSSVITRLKKDMVVMEQKVIQLTRMQRSSAPSSTNTVQLPLMSDNLLYDMSSTSPSSSDSESPRKHSECGSQGSITHKQNFEARSAAPSGDSFVTQRPKGLVFSSGEFKRTNRHTQQESKSTASRTRWV